MNKKTIKTILEIIKLIVTALAGYFGGNALSVFFTALL